MPTTEQPRRCLVPECGRTCTKGNHARGMCGRCYGEASRMVKLKQTTWLELMNMGFATVLSRREKVRKPTPLFVALENARQRQSAS